MIGNNRTPNNIEWFSGTTDNDPKRSKHRLIAVSLIKRLRGRMQCHIAKMYTSRSSVNMKPMVENVSIAHRWRYLPSSWMNLRGWKSVFDSGGVRIWIFIYLISDSVKIGWNQKILDDLCSAKMWVETTVQKGISGFFKRGYLNMLIINILCEWICYDWLKG